MSTYKYLALPVSFDQTFFNFTSIAPYPKLQKMFFDIFLSLFRQYAFSLTSRKQLHIWLTKDNFNLISGIRNTCRFIDSHSESHIIYENIKPIIHLGELENQLDIINFIKHVTIKTDISMPFVAPILDWTDITEMIKYPPRSYFQAIKPMFCLGKEIWIDDKNLINNLDSFSSFILQITTHFQHIKKINAFCCFPFSDNTDELSSEKMKQIDKFKDKVLHSKHIIEIQLHVLPQCEYTNTNDDTQLDPKAFFGKQHERFLYIGEVRPNGSYSDGAAVLLDFGIKTLQEQNASSERFLFLTHISSPPRPEHYSSLIQQRLAKIDQGTITPYRRYAIQLHQ